MDSVTQILLGSAVGEATGGRQFGRKAALWGAVLGTLPDLDVLVPLGDPVSDFTYHRSASHSLFIIFLATPLIAWLINRFHRLSNDDNHYFRWCVLVFLCLSTHALLDAFTVYGTQLLWPVIDYSASWSTLFIIDPLYTLPLLFGLFAAWILKKTPEKRRFANTIGLILSSAYLSWSIGTKFYVESVAAKSLPQTIAAKYKMLSTPAPFNTLLWRVILVDENNYYDGFYSVFDDEPVIHWKSFPRKLNLAKGLENHWPLQRLAWFTNDFYKLDSTPDGIVLYDLRMGLEPHYVFQFVIGKQVEGERLGLEAIQLDPVRDITIVSRVWDRIWDEKVSLHPSLENN